MADLADTIRNIPLFSALSREDIAKVLGKIEETSFDAGTRIFSQGDRGDSFYFIQSGAVQVVLESPGGRPECIGVLGSQEWFGEMALLSGEPRSATIIAIKDTTLWRLSREAWDELIEKHPTWLLQFCATLSKRLSRIEQQYSQGRDVFNSLAEEFYSSQSPEQQHFWRRASLLTTLNTQTVDTLLQAEGTQRFLADLKQSPFPLIRSLDGNRYELHSFFRDLLKEKLLGTEGTETTRQLQSQIAVQYERLGDLEQALHHFIEAEDWPRAIRLVITHKEQLLNGAALSLRNTIERIPPDHLFANPQLVHLKAEALAHLGDFGGAIRVYKEVLSQRASGALGLEAVVRYQNMADLLVEKRDYTQALNYLRGALNLLEQETTTETRDLTELYRETEESRQALAFPEAVSGKGAAVLNFGILLSRFYQRSSPSRWLGALLGFGIWGYLWFWTPDIGLEPVATKLLALLCLTLIYWVFWVFPDYGVALMLLD
jgi:CRP-like cAMP-binding protein